jgi:hypothetical protein
MAVTRRRSKGFLADFREIAFGTFDRGIASTSWLMGVVSLFMAVFLLKYPFHIPYLIVVRDLVFLFGFLLISLVIYGRYSKRERVFKNQRAYLSEVISRNHKISSTYHKDLFDGFCGQDFIAETGASCFSHAEIHRYQMMCKSVSNNIRESLLSYFRSLSIDLDGELSVSVKLIVDSKYLQQLFSKDPEKSAKIGPEKKLIITFARDHATLDEGSREVGECVYSIDSNTAYQYLFNSDEKCYCCDDLSSQTGYLNESKNWKSHYNAAIVVPIRYTSASGSFICYGFLTVDAPNPNGRSLFSDKNHVVHKECLAVLLHAADLLATHSLILRIQKLALSPSS